jgi:hypothetical protein
MLNYAKVVRLIVVVAAPVLAMAQATPGKPSPQQRAQAHAPANAPALEPPASPDSRRFASNENYFRAGVRPQPASPAPNSAQSVGSNPATPNSAVNGASHATPLPQRPSAAQPTQTAIAAAVPSRSPLPGPAEVISDRVDHDASIAVDYASGQLTVVADHAPLGYVLMLIAGKTGAIVDLAPELQQEPVMASLGPKPVREVLTSLLDSPRIDYIVFGTGDEPGSLQRIVVRRRQSFGNAGLGALRSAQPQQDLSGAQPDSNGHIISKRAIPGEHETTQEQRMEDWKKQRAQMLEAEMKQQAQDRENEKYQTQEQPAPQETQQQDNPPFL